VNRGWSVFSLLRYSRGAAAAHQSACAQQDQRRGGGFGELTGNLIPRRLV